MNRFGEPHGGTFLIRTVLPIVVATATLLATVSSIILWATFKADEVATERQHRLVQLIVSQLQSSISHHQESVTVWDDAVVHIRAGDLEWIDTNLGSWMHTYFEHDGAYVLDPADRPIYAYADGSRREPDVFEAIRSITEPLVRELRQRLRAGDTQGLSDKILTLGVSDISIVNGRLAIVSVKPIVPHSGDIEQVPGQEYAHIAIRYLDGSFVENLKRDYLLDGLRFAWESDLSDDEASIALNSRSGTPAGYFVWRPYLPGSTVLKEVAPFLLGATVAGLAALGYFLAALRRRSLNLRRSEAEVRHLASHDLLTGLPNRRQFEQRLDQAARSSMATGENIAVLYLDLDRFKQVNDTFGHPAGDELLREFAARLRGLVRPADTVARLGGDEFTILVRKLPSEESLKELCGRVVESARRPFEVAGTQAFIGVSVGAAVSTEGEADWVELTRRADVAMYHAKRAGRSAYALYEDEMNRSISARRDLERDLRRALAEGGQLQLHYQPLYSAATTRITGVEALLRWRHPHRGWIAPDLFIPIAEESGLIEKLGAWVLEEACRATAAWPIETVAVNVSAVELCNANFAMRVANTLMTTDTNPRRLELEVTESAFASQSGECERNMAALRELGVRFSLDDFGTGFSSLGRLHQFEVDRIKIDRSFVHGFGKDIGDEAIVKAIVDLAKASGLRTTAEGVETDAQGRYLKEIGCDELQGFLLSKPLPADEIEELWGAEIRRRARG